jgi:CRISPR-associated protein Csb2
MSGLTIGWEYLTGYAVATDPANRKKPEWPPHPARVFMALAAAWFQSDEDDAEGDVLRTLETLNPPCLALPPKGSTFPCSSVTVYVPVNDKAGPSGAFIQSAPTITRNKQARSFPRTYVGDVRCYMHWTDADTSNDEYQALDRLCRKVNRIGHSSSLVRMWAAKESEWAGHELSWFEVTELGADFQARRISNGFLAALRENYGAAARQRQVKLEAEIDALKAERKSIKGKGARERKTALDQKLEPLQQDLDNFAVREPVRPRVGLWSGYRRVSKAQDTGKLPHSHFDKDMLMLVRTGGPELGLTSTLTITQALRGALMEHSGVQPVPEWISGHQPNGDRSQWASGHLACIPLPFVGHEHSDGHLLGAGLLFPRSIGRRDRGMALGPVLLDEFGASRTVELRLGRLGVWQARKTDWSEQRRALQREAWTAEPQGSACWASVTPVVLDRYPKTDRRNDRTAWREEVAEIIAQACQCIGLPSPKAIDVDTSSWQLGAPRAIGKHRRLRGEPGRSNKTTASLGTGFPAYPAKGTQASRPQVHVWLEFSEPVIGPVVLGAGRFLGYGLCKPLERPAS